MPPSTPARSHAHTTFQSALLLTDHADNAVVDRSMLRTTGVRQVRVETSGLAAARSLAASVSTVVPVSTAEVVVCLPQLEDMNAAEFAALVRSHPLLSHIPLLAVIPRQGEESRLQEAGFNAVLQRPFTAASLGAQLDALAREAFTRRAELIASLRSRGAIPTHENFDRRLQAFIPPSRETMTAESAYREGVALMREHKWDKALPYLQKAAADTACQGEAGLAMATLWRARSEPGKVKASLEDALQGFLETGAWGKAQTLARRMAAEYPDAPNPLLRDLERRARSGRLGGMPGIVGLALDFAPAETVVAHLLGGCEAAPRPDAALDALLEKLTEDEELAEVVQALEKAAGRGPEEDKKRWDWLRRAFARKNWKQREPAPSGEVPVEREREAETEDDVLAPLPGNDASRPDDAAIAPLGGEPGDMPPSRLPAPLGDAWAVMRGTMRLYRSTK